MTELDLTAITFSSETIKLLEYIGSKIGVGIDWSQANIMPYLNTLINKYIQWYMADAIMWCIVGVAVLLLGTVLIIVSLKRGEFFNSLYAIFGTCCAGIGSIVSLYNIHTIILCKYFPEKIILDLITSYLSKK